MFLKLTLQSCKDLFLFSLLVVTNLNNAHHWFLQELEEPGDDTTRFDMLAPTVVKPKGTGPKLVCQSYYYKYIYKIKVLIDNSLNAITYALYLRIYFFRAKIFKYNTKFEYLIVHSFELE